MIVFLDASLKNTINYPHVWVEYLTIDDLWIPKFIASSGISPDYVQPGIYGSSDYFTIINAKTELMARAASLCTDERLTWVDFGISHMFGGYDHILNSLRVVSNLEPGLIIPGHATERTDELEKLPWRFLGGFFTGLRPDIADFHSHQVRAFKSIYPKVTYEVNVWAWAEMHQGFKPKWYPANFGSHFFNFRHFLIPPIGPSWS